MIMNSEMLSQAEIDALLRGNSTDNENENESNEKIEVMDDIEKDALGEIGNISMGTAATTLSTLLNQKVVITTPRVNITTVDELANEYDVPFVAIDVRYKSGLEGVNILILKANDVKIITDIMMGKETVDINRELTELDLSAVSEAMNQMMGSACTSLSEMFSIKIDIEPPRSYDITFNESRSKFDILKGDKPIVKVAFRMVIGEFIDSEVMQIIPVDFAKEIVNKLLGKENSIDNKVNVEEPQIDYESNNNNTGNINSVKYNEYSKPSNKPIEEPKYEKKEIIKDDETVTIKKPSFEAFDKEPAVSYNETIDLVGEIPVEITAELGKTTKKIGEILEYGPGTIIELDKLVGEPLDVFANGKFIAKGEVVVIDDNFGIRITDIINPYKKISNN